MEQFDNLFDNKDTRHFKTRAVGALWIGPLQDKGYDNRVVQLTRTEMDFRNSVEAQRFMDVQRRKYASTQQLNGANNLRFASRRDDF